VSAILSLGINVLLMIPLRSYPPVSLAQRMYVIPSPLSLFIISMIS
jgi:hypothetical protein